MIVCHPVRQYSDRLAEALEHAGALGGYWTGGFATNKVRSRLIQKAVRKLATQEIVDLPDDLVRFHVRENFARGLTAKIFPQKIAAHVEFWSYRAFDRWCARQLPASAARAVVGYEMSCEATFRQAKALGMATVLDAAALHYRAQDPFLSKEGESAELARRIRNVKDAELALADFVLVTSEFARQSYLEAGYPDQRLFVLPLGADIELFRPVSRPAGPVRFVFVGSACHRKGTDILLAAFRQALGEGCEARLQFVGHVPDEYGPAIEPIREHVEVTGKINHEGLSRLLLQAHCLVLPSRIDSFGMVVIEALATGMPAIVTDHVGANMAVEEGSTGWVVPHGQVAPLAERIGWVARNPAALREMAPRCREMAERFSWNQYGSKVKEAFGKIADA